MSYNDGIYLKRLFNKYKYGLKSDNNEVRRAVEKYNGYRNLTMTNEKSITTYRKIKETFMKEYQSIKSFEEYLGAFIESNNSESINYASCNKENIRMTIDKTNGSLEILKADSLTDQLGKDLYAYAAAVDYLFKLITQEKQINKNVLEQKANTEKAKHMFLTSLNQVEGKINKKITQGRKGNI